MNEELLLDLAAFTNDPYGFVLWAFPWGEAGELFNLPGPHPWQAKVLREIRDGLKTPAEAILEAVASGHGIGKSALVSWIILWAISTFEDTRGVVTANTMTQLQTKTWAELGKWYRLFLAKELFKLTATAIYSCDPERDHTWRIDMVPWSKERPEAFAGLHNADKRILMLFDEGSTIDDTIYEVAEGALTDKSAQRIWCIFGNPTRNSGRFREIFKKPGPWKVQQIDSRDVPGTDENQIKYWEESYGEDSDFFRVRVKGDFPRSSSSQLIPFDLVETARTREIQSHEFEALVFGLDVARYGDNESVLFARRGRDARNEGRWRWQGLSTVQLADAVANLIALRKPDGVFVDEGGVGGGVVDYLRMLGFSIIGVNFGGKAAMAPRGTLVANKRAEMYVNGLHWLQDGGALPDDEKLAKQLISTQYGFNAKNAILLESKDDMRRRGEESPDDSDALMLTFAYPVAKIARAGRIAKVDYNPYAVDETEPPLVLPPELQGLTRMSVH
jgi:hypothetical protein